MRNFIRTGLRVTVSAALMSALLITSGATSQASVSAPAATAGFQAPAAYLTGQSVSIPGLASLEDQGRVVRVYAFTKTHSREIRVGSTRVGVDGKWLVTFQSSPRVEFNGLAPLRVAMKSLDGTQWEAYPTITSLVMPSAPVVVPTAPKAPLTPVMVNPAGSPTSYQFLQVGANGNPSHWDRCTPVGYYINPANSTPEAIETVKTAFVELARVSGMTFTYMGETQSVPFAGGTLSQGTMGTVAVAFATEDMVPLLAGNTQGYGGFYAVDSGNGQDSRIISGGLVLDTMLLNLPGFGSGFTLGGLTMHELGHVLNLGHVADPTQLMNPMLSNTSPDTFQAGDIGGLNGIASLGCF